MSQPKYSGAETGPSIGGSELYSLLLKERETTCALIEEWMVSQKKMYAEHVSQQDLLFQRMLEAHRATLQCLFNDSSSAAAVNLRMNQGEPAALQDDMKNGDKTAEGDVSSKLNVKKAEGDITDGPKSEETEGGNAQGANAQEKEELSIEEDLEALQKNDDVLAWWRRTSGMQTVHKWVTNYKKHPAGWGALLMIQGIPEVTGRLRSKVENYAIYSALFLSMSIALLTDAPSFILKPCPEQDLTDVDWWLCHIRLRVYLYGFAIGTAAHMLSILLAMSFVNALNETARDSDVYRMFARGKGFLATQKCQYAFRLGCVADFVAVMIAVTYHIGWEAVLGTIALVVVIYRKREETTKLLFNNASIVKYWREELGGKPDKDDPYDLQIPVGVFNECAKVNNNLFLTSQLAAGDSETATSALWDTLHSALKPDTRMPKATPHEGSSAQLTGRNQVHSAAVAALF